MARVGIIGGGQLGLMLAESLDRLGQTVVVLEPDPDAPCAQRRANVLQASFSDPRALEEFFSRVDIATFDSENTPAPPLVPFAARLAPSLRVLETSQDRAKEKTFLAAHGFRPVVFQVVPPGADVKSAARAFGFPCIAKSVLGGYDGKGQYRLTGEADLPSLPASAPGGGCSKRCSLSRQSSRVSSRVTRAAPSASRLREPPHPPHPRPDRRARAPRAERCRTKRVRSLTASRTRSSSWACSPWNSFSAPGVTACADCM